MNFGGGSYSNLTSGESKSSSAFGSLSGLVGFGSLPLLKRRGSTSQERWVCPDDRQLALRAKIQMGWSTGQMTPAAKPMTLSQNETKTIMDVIKRAEELETGEQSRIGRLVYKVENMKRKRLGNGISSCILCGGSLPILRTSSIVCSDCNNGVCSKCGVEVRTPSKEPIWLCKICSETREMWKRSGAWFFHGVPKHILPSLCNRSAPKRWNTTAGKGTEDKEIISEDELTKRNRLQKVVSECTGDLQDASHLCLSPRPKVAGMPPVTPDSVVFPLPPRARSASPSPLRIDIPSPRNSLDVGDRHVDRSPLSPCLSPRDFSRTPSRDNPGEAGGFLTPRYTPSPSLSSRNELRRDTAFDRSPSPLMRLAWRDSGRSSNSLVSESSMSCSREDPEADYRTADAVRNDSSSGAIITQASIPIPVPALPTSTPSSSSSGMAGSASPIINGFRSRRGSEASKSSLEDRKTSICLKSSLNADLRASRESLPRDLHQYACNESSSGDVFQESASESVPPFYKQIRGSHYMGQLEFSLMYDSHSQSLHVTLHSAKELRPGQEEATTDPYVKIHLLPGASKSNKLRSKTALKTVNPLFNETLTYYGISDEDMAKKTLRFTIMDEDKFKHEFLGEVRIPLKSLIPHESKKFKSYIEKKTSRSDDDSKKIEHGKILLSLKYSTQRSLLIIGIVRCAHLPSMDPNGFSDPYVKVQIREQKNVLKKFRTAIKWKNLNPEFNEEFTYDIKRNELAGKILDVRVYDRDVGRTDDFIGGVMFSQESAGAPLRHWYDVLRYPDRRHDRWHQLEDIGK